MLCHSKRFFSNWNRKKEICVGFTTVASSNNFSPYDARITSFTSWLQHFFKSLINYVSGFRFWSRFVAFLRGWFFSAGFGVTYRSQWSLPEVHRLFHSLQELRFPCLINWMTRFFFQFACSIAKKEQERISCELSIFSILSTKRAVFIKSSSSIMRFQNSPFSFWSKRSKHFSSTVLFPFVIVLQRPTTI